MGRPDERVWLDMAKAFETELEPIDFVLPGFKAGTVGALVSPGATGKTMLALQAAVTVAGGPDTLGLAEMDKEWSPKPGRVVLLGGEDPADIMSRRLYSVGKHLKELSSRVLEPLCKNLSVAALVGYGADLMDDEWRSWIAETTKGARLVILDTLRRFHQLDENDNGQMARLLSYLEQLCRQNSTSVLFLHHTSKSAALGGNGDVQQASRGSSVLTDNARFQANLLGMSPEEAEAYAVDPDERHRFVRLVFAKVNYSAPIGERWFFREPGGTLMPASLKRIEKQRAKGREQSKY